MQEQMGGPAEGLWAQGLEPAPASLLPLPSRNCSKASPATSHTCWLRGPVPEGVVRVCRQSWGCLGSGWCLQGGASPPHVPTPSSETRGPGPHRAVLPQPESVRECSGLARPVCATELTPLPAVQSLHPPRLCHVPAWAFPMSWGGLGRFTGAKGSYFSGSFPCPTTAGFGMAPDASQVKSEDRGQLAFLPAKPNPSLSQAPGHGSLPRHPGSKALASVAALALVGDENQRKAHLPKLLEPTRGALASTTSLRCQPCPGLRAGRKTDSSQAWLLGTEARPPEMFARIKSCVSR